MCVQAWCPYTFVVEHNLIKPTDSENTISQINSNVFFKEFTFSKNDFTDLNSKQKLEFSDNVVSLGDIFFVFEIKERTSNTGDEKKWFNNKVLKTAVRQIKNTHKYLESYSSIPIINEKGHTINIVEANFSDIQNIIIYSADTSFNEECRFIKCYQSDKIGLVNLFHIEDYYWVCKYLLTPAEIKEYLKFREELYINHSSIIDNLPEQYVLGHFLETPDASFIDPSFIDSLNKFNPDSKEFDLSFLLNEFEPKIKLQNTQTEYYPIIAEIAKLNREELTEFKRRFLRTIEQCKSNEYDLSYRMYLPRTDCAFVFIPLIDIYIVNIGKQHYTTFPLPINMNNKQQNVLEW